MSVNELQNIGLTAIAIATALLELEELEKPIKRRWWERPHLGIRKRNIYGQQVLLKEMAVSDRDSFFSITRLRPDSFWKLLSIVGPSITHYSPRPPIDPHTRLCVTLRYLTTGESRTSLSYTYRLGISTTSEVIDETLSAIYNNIQPIYMPEPTTEMLLESAKGFALRWSFPNCCAAVDGKHIRTRKPVRSGSRFWNYKNYHSLVLMAATDYKHRFLAIDVGCEGSKNDSIIFNSSLIGRKLMTGTLNMPGPSEIPFGPTLPHFMLADTIFGNRSYLITPYPGKATGNLNYEEKIFNYRQSRGRRVIENTFGIYASEFRIFYTAINAVPEIVDRIVMATACLHNFRLTEQDDVPFDLSERPDKRVRTEFKSIFDSIAAPEDEFLDELDLEGNSIRDQLAEYFVSDGAVYWQDLMIN